MLTANQLTLIIRVSKGQAKTFCRLPRRSANGTMFLPILRWDTDMKSKGFEGMTCSIASVMGTLGVRWGTIIMRDLILGLARYDDLRRSSGITNATLSDRLKVLEQNGLIERRQYQSRPDRYEYVPTPRGRDVGLVMQAMVQVGDKWNLPELKGPPVRFVNIARAMRLKS